MIVPNVLTYYIKYNVDSVVVVDKSLVKTLVGSTKIKYQWDNKYGSFVDSVILYLKLFQMLNLARYCGISCGLRYKMIMDLRPLRSLVLPSLIQCNSVNKLSWPYFWYVGRSLNK